MPIDLSCLQKPRWVNHPYADMDIFARLRQAGEKVAWMKRIIFAAGRMHAAGGPALGENHTFSALKPDSSWGTVYEFQVEGNLTSDWQVWFEGLQINPYESDTTILSGRVADQAALHGILAKIRDLNLVLISVRRL